jgi:hypothetical protein
MIAGVVEVVELILPIPEALGALEAIHVDSSRSMEEMGTDCRSTGLLCIVVVIGAPAGRGCVINGSWAFTVGWDCWGGLAEGSRDARFWSFKDCSRVKVDGLAAGTGLVSGASGVVATLTSVVRAVVAFDGTAAIFSIGGGSGVGVGRSIPRSRRCLPVSSMIRVWDPGIADMSKRFCREEMMRGVMVLSKIPCDTRSEATSPPSWGTGCGDMVMQ